MDNQGRDLERLRFEVSRGLLVSGMKATKGWELLEEELRKMLAAYKAKAVDPTLIGRGYEHATVVGGHNALQSLLDVLDGIENRGKLARTKLETAQDKTREQDAADRKFQRF